MDTHEYADIFPMMSGKEFKELKKDIGENGLQQSIITFEGKILDGRNRFNACKELDIEPTMEEYEGDNALQYVMSTNLRRRHLTDSQKAVVGIKYKKYYSKFAKERMMAGTPSVPEHKGRASEKAGETVGVRGRIIDMAEAVIKKNPEMEAKIMAGEIKVKQAYREIQLEEQKKEIEELKEVTGEYDVLVIDPPWQYEGDYDPDSRRGATPYPTMTIPEIRNIKLPAKEDCVIWLWTTHKFIWDAIEILENWGFEYKAILVWDKEKLGIGKRLRMQCEFCLVGTRGKPYWKLTNQRDIIREPRTTHSTKPETFYKMVEEICAGRKLDYFARKEREGWEVYGNEVNSDTFTNNNNQKGGKR